MSWLNKESSIKALIAIHEIQRAFYEKHIRPTLMVVLQAAEWLERFPVLQRMINERM